MPPPIVSSAIYKIPLAPLHVASAKPSAGFKTAHAKKGAGISKIVHQFPDAYRRNSLDLGHC